MGVARLLPPLLALTHMKLLIVTIIFGWVIGVTFFGSEIARAVNAPMPTKQIKRHR